MIRDYDRLENQLVESQPRKELDEAEFCKVARVYLETHTMADLAKLVCRTVPHLRRILKRNA